MPSRRMGALAGLALTLALFAAPSASAAACAPVTHDAARYTVCTFRADSDDIRLWHTEEDGTLLGSFRAVDSSLRSEGRRLAFAMNGGMYHEDRAPVGHYVEDGREKVRVITSSGPGNFGLLPNGVFCVGDGAAQVWETQAYVRARPACDYATQSGPMLVIDGALHPRFLPRSDSLHIRNGVGVAEDGVTVHFAISEERVNFHAFGRLFRDHLRVPNALYFDGRVSRLYAPEIGRSDLGLPMGPIVGVAEPSD